MAQAKASEDAVADLFGKLLPRAIIRQNSYHTLTGTTCNKKRYEESDIVVSFEDVMLSAEVKGGPYCPTLRVSSSILCSITARERELLGTTLASAMASPIKVTTIDSITASPGRHPLWGHRQPASRGGEDS